MKINALSILGVLFYFSCMTSCEADNNMDLKEERKTYPKWVNDMFSAHGELNDFSFDFRGANYSFHHDEGGFRYTKLIETDSLIQKDIFTSEGYTRVVNGDTLQLKKEENKKYSESLNSVIYFVCLPQKL